MRNIRIAILDSGISEELRNHINIIGEKNFYYDFYDEAIVTGNTANDLNGHGTMCVDTIIHAFPHVDFYLIKILNVSGIAHKSTLDAGLRYAAALDADIVALCASLCHTGADDSLRARLREITDSGAVTVAAVENGMRTSEPAADPNVIGVIGGELSDDAFIYDSKDSIQMQCASSAAFVRTAFGRRASFQGNSRAAALAAAHIARILYENNCAKEQLEQLLIKNAYSTCKRPLFLAAHEDRIRKIEYNADRENDMLEYEIGYHRTIYALCEFFSCDEPSVIRRHNLLELENRFLLRHLDAFFAFITERFGITLTNPEPTYCQWAYTFYEKYLMQHITQKGK